MRIVIFLSLNLLFFLIEMKIPRKPKLSFDLKRKLSNFGLIFLGSLCTYLLFPLGLLEFTKSNVGSNAFYGYFSTGSFISILLTVLVLDLMIYWQHVLSHQFEWLWRLHRVHHTDPALDFSSGFRFHPLEILFSLLYKILVIFIFQLDFNGVLVFEILLSSSAIFNHSNFYLGEKFDLLLRKVIVTPDFHRIHHSVIRKERNSNYGFFLSVWDYLFSSYEAREFDYQDSLKIGMEDYHEEKKQTLWQLLIQPFKS